MSMLGAYIIRFQNIMQNRKLMETKMLEMFYDLSARDKQQETPEVENL